MRGLYLLMACAMVIGTHAGDIAGTPPATVVTYDDLIANLTASILDKYNSGVTGLDNLASTWSTSVKSLASQLTTGYAAYDATYCSTPSFDIGGLKPAAFVGSSFNLTFSTGECTFNETAFLVDGIKELTCSEPSLVYGKTPSKYTSKYYAAASFVGKECKLSKDFGTESTSTLAVFDGSTKVSATDLTAQITAELKALLSTLGS